MKLCIWETAKAVIEKSGRPLTVDEIYKTIMDENLYQFGAKSPKSVLSSAIREKSDQNPKAKNVVFKQTSANTYDLI